MTQSKHQSTSVRLVLDKEEAKNIIKADSERQQADEIMNKLINDKDVLKLLAEKIKNINS